MLELTLAKSLGHYDLFKGQVGLLHEQVSGLMRAENQIKFKLGKAM